jgi:aryl-alcohol dehydrogenase-like predicted oxidoreductase
VLLAQADDIVPIPGTRNAKRLEENAGAAEIEILRECRRSCRMARSATRPASLALPGRLPAQLELSRPRAS